MLRSQLHDFLTFLLEVILHYTLAIPIITELFLYSGFFTADILTCYIEKGTLQKLCYFHQWHCLTSVTQRYYIQKFTNLGTHRLHSLSDFW